MTSPAGTASAGTSMKKEAFTFFQSQVWLTPTGWERMFSHCVCNLAYSFFLSLIISAVKSSRFKSVKLLMVLRNQRSSPSMIRVSRYFFCFQASICLSVAPGTFSNNNFLPSSRDKRKSSRMRDIMACKESISQACFPFSASLSLLMVCSTLANSPLFKSEIALAFHVCAWRLPPMKRQAMTDVMILDFIRFSYFIFFLMASTQILYPSSFRCKPSEVSSLRSTFVPFSTNSGKRLMNSIFFCLARISSRALISGI